MEKRFERLFNKYWLICWVLFASLAFMSLGGVVWAEYVKTNSAKLVVAREGESGKMFSSNCLQQGQSMANTTVYVDSEDTELIEFVRIANYAQGNPGKPYSRSVNYSLNIGLVYLDNGQYIPFSDTSKIGDRYITVSINGGETLYFGKHNSSYEHVSETYTTSRTLHGGSPNTDILRVEYSADQKDLLTNPDPDFPKMYLEITATPTPASSYLDLEPLKGRLDLRLTGQVQSVVWSGYINEVGAKSDITPAPTPATTLDDYNYVIEGVGEGTITLTWNATYLELNKDFVTEISAIEGNSSTSNSLTFKVDSSDISRYDTQFYRTGQALNNYDTWAEVNGYITCDFTPDSGGTP